MCESLREFYADGVKEKRIKNTKQLFKHFYPKKDSSIIDKLTTEQCNQVFSTLLENKSFEEIINTIIVF